MMKNFFLAEFMTTIAIKLSFPLRIIAFLFLALATTEIAAQNCNCPKLSNCKPCSGGGFTSFTVKYNGLLNGVVTVYDAGGLIKATTVSKGDLFSFSGSIPGEKFQGPTVNIFFDALPAATFYTTCNAQYPGDVSGAFELVSMVSKGGGIVCCAPGALDNQAPVFSNVPTDKIENLPGTSCTKTVNWTPPTVTDNCKYKVTSTHQPNSTLFTRGIHTVTYTATDSAGNVAIASFKVTVNDVTAPTIDGGCPLTITLAANEQCQAEFELPVKTATDACGNATVVNNHPSKIFPLGPTIVTYTATDASGNSSSCILKVMVEDNAPPVFKDCPSVVPGTKDASCKTSVELPKLTVTDNCTNNVSYTSSHPDNTDFPLGETTVTYTAVDNAGNKATCVFNVVVSNSKNPEIKNCPGTKTENTTPNEPDSVAVMWEEPQATVVCGEIKEVERSHAPGSKFPVGKTSVTYTFKDEGGKSSTCTFDVVVFASDEPFAISKVITPDGDGINDVWTLPNIEDFKNNTVVIVDRWGNKIFHATGYDNVHIVWNGTNKNGTIVPTGTYFYTIEVRDQGKVMLKKGFIELIQ